MSFIHCWHLAHDIFEPLSMLPPLRVECAKICYLTCLYKQHRDFFCWFLFYVWNHKSVRYQRGFFLSTSWVSFITCTCYVGHSVGNWSDNTQNFCIFFFFLSLYFSNISFFSRICRIIIKTIGYKVCGIFMEINKQAYYKLWLGNRLAISGEKNGSNFFGWTKNIWKIFLFCSWE